MSLTSSLYSGISGMTNLGNAMQIIGDNIANVNTTAFKGSNYIFQDLLSQAIATQSGTAQVGRGMALGDVSSNHQQGSFESTGNATDLAIGGDGFFVLREADSESEVYSRAGSFRFDKDGVLINPEGYIVQGWALDENSEDIGAVTDIMLTSFTSPPDLTEHMTVITNLDSDSISQTTVLSNSWDSGNTSPIDASNYHYQSVVKIYDSLGSTHDITIYYDKKSGSVWEYMISCNPDEDQRNLVQDTSAVGLLARGTITFSDSSGNVSGFTMEELTGRIGNVDVGGSLSGTNPVFAVNNYDALTQDGYDFSLVFDGSSWDFEDIAPPTGVITSADLPPNYPNASIISSDLNSIQINLDGDIDRTTDLTVTFDLPAQALDSISFDINSPTDIHVQNVTNLLYTGDTAGDNTSLEINHPEVLTNDSTDLQINWDASAQSWYWSMPQLQNIMNTDTSSLTPAVTATETVTDSSVMTNYSEDVSVWYDSVAGDWNFASPYARELSNEVYTGGISQASTTTTISNVTALTEHSTGNILAWDNIVGVTNMAFTDISGSGEITALTTTMTELQEDNLIYDSSIPYVLEYDGIGDAWSWIAGGDPNVDYPNRQVPTWDSVANQLAIDLTGDGTDITFDFAGNLTAASDGDRFSFDVDADGQWAWAMPTMSVASYGGGVSASNTTMNIESSLSGGGNIIDSTGGDYNLTFDGANWGWGANSPADADYASEVFITDTPNEVAIDLDADGTAEITFTFETPLALAGTVDFSIDATGNPPAEYSSATIMSTSGPNLLSLDMTGNGNADITYTYLSTLSADGTVGFDLDTHIPPLEYQNAAIDSTLSTPSRVYIDLNGDSTNDVDFAFSAALTDNGTFQFDIDPRVSPTEYPNAVVTGDRDEALIDMNNDGVDDITFSFDTPLPTGATALDSSISFDVDGSTAWTQVETNANGYFEFMADFLGGENGVTEMDVEFDIGSRDDGTGQFVNNTMTTTQYARSSTTTLQSADGYGAGDLQGVDVDVDGVMTGIYSNGQLIPLYRVALARFLNIQGLSKEGGGLYSETRDSGTAITNRPGTNGLGSISPNSLEQSNVDIANEFVRMIVTQRGFQANSKIVTTIDAMLGEVINMKR